MIPEILFEDVEIMVCIKPSGVLSQADFAGKESMITLLQAHTGGTVYPVHRLDKETAGVMVFAKTAAAAAGLSAQIASHDFEKQYLAVVHGTPPVSGEMRDLLFRDAQKNKSYVVDRMRRGVKDAALIYRRLGSEEIDGMPFSLVRVTLLTGRTHQIRVQFSHRKMPLAGDRKYGEKDGFSDLQLWSYRLSFSHPKTKEKLTFSAEPTGSVIQMMLGKYSDG